MQLGPFAHMTRPAYWLTNDQSDERLGIHAEVHTHTSMNVTSGRGDRLSTLGRAEVHSTGVITEIARND